MDGARDQLRGWRLDLSPLKHWRDNL
jgi:hypothetical protein